MRSVWCFRFKSDENGIKVEAEGGKQTKQFAARNDVTFPPSQSQRPPVRDDFERSPSVHSSSPSPLCESSSLDSISTHTTPASKAHKPIMIHLVPKKRNSNVSFSAFVRHHLAVCLSAHCLQLVMYSPATLYRGSCKTKHAPLVGQTYSQIHVSHTFLRLRHTVHSFPFDGFPCSNGY